LIYGNGLNHGSFPGYPRFDLRATWFWRFSFFTFTLQILDPAF